ncbi:hypothetical protein [Chryseobacterium wanjuense]
MLHKNINIISTFLWYYANESTGKLVDVMAYLGQENATGVFFEDAFHKEFNSGGGGEETFGETQKYKELMASFYFGNINFSQFLDEDPGDPPSNKEITPFQLGVEWLTGTGLGTEILPMEI